MPSKKLIEIRPILPEEWDMLREFVIRIVKSESTAFSTTPEEETTKTVEMWLEDLAYDSTIKEYGAFNSDGKIIGMVKASRGWHEKTKHLGLVYRLSVLKEYRKCGTATRLLDEALIYLKQQGCVFVDIDLSADVQSGLDFFQNYGFKRVGELPHFLHVGEKFYDFYKMQFDLRCFKKTRQDY